MKLDERLAVVETELRNIASVQSIQSGKLDLLITAHHQQIGMVKLGQVIAAAVGAIVATIAGLFTHR